MDFNYYRYYPFASMIFLLSTYAWNNRNIVKIFTVNNNAKYNKIYKRWYNKN